MTWLLAHWKEAALALALGACVAIGYGWRSAAVARAEWQQRYRATTAHGDSLEKSLARARHESAVSAASLDSALAGWDSVRAALVSHGTSRRVDTVRSPALAATPHAYGDTPTLGVVVHAGDELASAVRSFEATAARADSISELTIDTLHARIKLLEDAPKQPRLERWVAGGYDLTGSAAVRAGLTLHLSPSWAIDADATRRLGPADTIRIAAWIRHVF